MIGINEKGEDMKILGSLGMILLFIGASGMDSEKITLPVMLLSIGLVMLFTAGKMYEKTERKR